MGGHFSGSVGNPTYPNAPQHVGQRGVDVRGEACGVGSTEGRRHVVGGLGRRVRGGRGGGIPAGAREVVHLGTDRLTRRPPTCPGQATRAGSFSHLHLVAARSSEHDADMRPHARVAPFFCRALALFSVACQGGMREAHAPVIETQVDVLWVGAHPDVESVVAPILAADCVDGELTCGLLVLTRGEAGTCKRPALCADEALPDVRSRELAASAALFGAGVEAWDLGDGTGGDAMAVIDAWSARSGGADALLARMVDALGRWSPSVVYTFDARHGTTCHPDHRATAGLLVAAAADLGETAPEVRLVESMLDSSIPPGIGFRVATDDAAVVRVDATTVLPSIGGEAWEYAVRVLEVHRTQYTDDEVAALGAATPEQRPVYWLGSRHVIEDDPRYASLCSP